MVINCQLPKQNKKNNKKPTPKKPYHKTPVNNIQRLEQEHQEPEPQNTNIKQSKERRFLQILKFEHNRNSTNTCFEFYLNDYQCKN